MLSATDQEAVAHATPPHTHLTFNRTAEAADVTWLVAESHWAESFPPPSTSEFARWALFVVPNAIMLHVVPGFRRAWDLNERVKREGLTQETLRELNRVVGEDWETRIGGDGWRVQLTGLILGHAFQLALEFVFLLAIGIPVQLLLLATIPITALPVGFLRSFAGWIQNTLAASIGDSFVLVVSPIRASAIVSQVERDLRWLASKSDRVAIVAHSQGAAVSYWAAKRFLDREHNLSQKLTLLVTYGSGLRKLFDLDISSQKQTHPRGNDWQQFGSQSPSDLPSLFCC